MPAIPRLLILTVVLVLGGVFSSRATELVSPEEIRTALRAAASQRLSDLEAVDAILTSPGAREAASRMGVDTNIVRAALPTLSDAELRDITARAEALESDPAAGLSSDVNDMLVIFLIVAIVILVLKAAD